MNDRPFTSPDDNVAVEDSLEPLSDKKDVISSAEHDDDENDPAAFHLAHEAYQLLYISLPAVAVNFCVRLVFPQTASAVGRILGTTLLAAFSLGSLTANLTCQSIIMGALTAAETLMPRAYGSGRYVQMGQLAVQGFVVCGVLLLLPMLLLCTNMEWFFEKLGQDKDASLLASKWIRMYLLAIPSTLMLRVLQAFLNAQHIVMPMVFGSAVGSFVVHPILLHYIIPALGLMGSALCIALTLFCMVLLVFLYLYMKSEHHAETWPGLSREFVRNALQPGPLWTFAKLSLGGVLSLSEWWFWETTCFIVGSFGVIPLAVHSIAYNVIPVVFMGAVGLATGLVVRIGTELTANVSRAKQIAMWCMGFAVVVGALVSSILYQLRISIIRLFTNDDDVLQACLDIWGKVCMFVFILYVFAINRAILRALGMQWRIAAVVVVCMWCGALPAILYNAVYLRQELDAVWTILPLFYSIMQVLLILSYTRVDWKHVCDDGDQNGKPSSMVEGSKDVEMESLNLIT